MTTKDKLVSAARNASALAAQMDDILATYIDPPIPDKPTATSATNTIITQAQHTIDVANQVLRRLQGG